MEYRVKQLLKGKLVPAMLSIVLGIVIIIARRAAVDVLVKIIGGLVIASGFAFIAMYLTRKNKEAGNLQMVLVCGGLTVLIGLMLIHFAPTIVDFFPTLMGIFLILNGLSHLTAAYASPGNRILIGIMGVVVIALGVLIVLRPGFIVDMTMVFIGGSFIINGVMDLLMIRRVKEKLILN